MNTGAERVYILKNDNVLEMLEVFAERYPDFNEEFAKPFLDMPPQTLLHGDFHNGNHMYLEEDGVSKVVAIDFQMVGNGLACSDVIKLLNFSRRHILLSDDLELWNKYYNALVLSGVKDYAFEDMKSILL